MPKLHAIGVTIQGGTAHFENVKTISIVFGRSFTMKPTINITPGDSGTLPLYRTSVTNTGFVIRCKSQRAGELDRKATERAV